MVFSLISKKFVRGFFLTFLVAFSLTSLAEDLAKDKGKESFINFGVVKNNQTFQIYRSSLLGSKGLAFLKKHLEKENLPFPKTIIYMNKEGYSGIPLVGTFAMEEYHGQLQYGFNFYHSFGYDFRTYLDGHNPYQPDTNIDTPFILGAAAAKEFGRIDHEEVDGGVDAFYRIMETVLNPQNQPVLFHCFGGMHRTGMVGMALRYLEGGHWINGPKKKVFIPHYAKTFDFNPAQYEYYTHNKAFFRIENMRFIEQFTQNDAKFEELKRMYSLQLKDNE